MIQKEMDSLEFNAENMRKILTIKEELFDKNQIEDLIRNEANKKNKRILFLCENDDVYNAINDYLISLRFKTQKIFGKNNEIQILINW